MECINSIVFKERTKRLIPNHILRQQRGLSERTQVVKMPESVVKKCNQAVRETNICNSISLIRTAVITALLIGCFVIPNRGTANADADSRGVIPITVQEIFNVRPQISESIQLYLMNKSFQSVSTEFDSEVVPSSVIDYELPQVTDVRLLEHLDSLNSSEERKELIQTAFSLVGRVPYFWGGKSAPGWNNEWNTQKKVTSTGSRTTGTTRPYGLDCSGFAHWVYKTALGIDIEHGTTVQWSNCEEIAISDLQPGDMGWLRDPKTAGANNHVLIYVGMENGNRIWVHCDSDGVVCNSPNNIQYYGRVKGFSH